MEEFNKKHREFLLFRKLKYLDNYEPYNCDDYRYLMDKR